MKKFILLGCLFVASFSYAFILGELKGAGKFESTSKVEATGQSYNYKAACELALNIHDNLDSFDFEFGYFACGGVVFNSFLPELKKIGGKLYNSKNGKLVEVGEILPDQSIHVRMIYPTQSKKVTEYIPDGVTCALDRTIIRQRTFYLNSHADYKFKKDAEGKWDLEIRWYQEGVTNYSKKVGLCLYDAYSKNIQSSQVVGSVK